jgi:hypothetical protein
MEATKLGQFLGFRYGGTHAKNWAGVIKFPRPTYWD